MNTLTPQALQLKPNCDVTGCQATSQISVDSTPGGHVYMNLPMYIPQEQSLKLNAIPNNILHMFIIIYVSIMCDIHVLQKVKFWELNNRCSYFRVCVQE